MKELRDILLISKDRNLRNAAGGMLEAAGHSVHTASSMRDALGVLSSEPIGLIICGLELEDIHATDFIAYLKNDPLRETIPFVFYIHAQNRADLPPKHALDLGADDVILYPHPVGELIRRVGKYISPGDSVSGKSDPIPESFPLQKEDVQADQQPAGIDKRGVRLSIDGRLWAEGNIINHTYHGAMIETRLRGKQGRTVWLRCGFQDGTLTAIGRLMHILLGDHERPMGMGINFRGDSNWRRIHQKMKTAAEPAVGGTETATSEEPPLPVDTPQQESSPAAEKGVPDRRVTPEVPIGIEVSRDGALWMYGEIEAYDGSGAAITTPVLGKSG